MVQQRKQAMTRKRELPEEPPVIPNRLRSGVKKACLNESERKNGASSSAAPPALTNSTVAAAAEGALVIAKSAPMEAATISNGRLEMLATLVSVIPVHHTSTDTQDAYAKEVRKLYTRYYRALRKHEIDRKRLVGKYNKDKLAYAQGKERLRQEPAVS